MLERRGSDSVSGDSPFSRRTATSALVRDRSVTDVSGPPTIPPPSWKSYRPKIGAFVASRSCASAEGFALQNPPGVLRQRRIEDRRVRRQGRRALEHLVEGEIVPPDEVQAPLEPLELGATAWSRQKIFEQRRTYSDKDGGRVGTNGQDVVDDPPAGPNPRRQSSGATARGADCRPSANRARSAVPASRERAGRGDFLVKVAAWPAHRDDDIQPPAGRLPTAGSSRLALPAKAEAEGRRLERRGFQEVDGRSRPPAQLRSKQASL